MAIRFSNNAQTTLASGITATATSISVADGSVFPALTPGDHTYVTLEDTLGNLEIVKVTAISSNTLTVTRGQDGTTARAFSSGDFVQLRVTAALLNDLADEASVTLWADVQNKPDPVITLAGDASGSATLTDLGNATLTVTIADDSHNHVISNVDGLQAALNAKQDGSTSLTTSTTFGGDVSGAYNAIVVANDSHTHDTRYYTETEIDNYFSGSSAITGYNKTNWDTAYGWGNHASAGYQAASTALTTSTTFGGDVSGTYNAIVVANDSHTHDGRYYTESEIDTRIDNNTLYATDALTSATNLDDVTDNGFYRWTSSAPTNNPSGTYHNMIVQTDGGQPTQLVWGGSGNSSADLHIRRRDSGTWRDWTEFVNSSTQFGGDVSGTYDSIVIADDSHNHIISNVDGLQSALDDLTPTSNDTFNGTYPLVWVASDVLYSSTFMTINGATDTLSAPNISTGSISASDITTTSDLGVGISPAFRFHAYHPTTNVVARFESGDSNIWIDLHDSNSGTYGALLGHDSTNLFKVADSATNIRMALSPSGLLDTDAGYSVLGNTVIDSSRNLTSIASFTLDGAGSTIQLATDRPGLIEITDSGESYTGIQISKSAGDHWSVMGSTTNFGLYDDQNQDWILQHSQGGGTLIYHNGNAKLETTSSGVTVTGIVQASSDVEAQGGYMNLSSYTSGTVPITVGMVDIRSGGKTGWAPGDELGKIRWYANDTSGNWPGEVASIRAVCQDGNGSTTTVGSAALEFYTTPYNSITQSMALRLDTDQTADFQNSIKMGGTTVINSSRNLTNIGSYTGSGQLVVGPGTLALNSDANITVNEGNAFAGIDLKSTRTSGNSGGIRSYNSSNVVMNEVLLRVDGKVNISNSGGLMINDSTVIDGSRNITNVPSITLGGNSENQIQLLSTSLINGVSTNITQIEGRQIDLYAYDKINIRTGGSATDTIHFTAVGAERLEIGNGYVDVKSASLQIGGTTVIDTSRNLTNINSFEVASTSVFQTQGIATSSTQGYTSARLEFQASGWDTNNSLARTEQFSIQAEASGSIYPDIDLCFYAETPNLGHKKLQLHGRGSGAGSQTGEAGTFFGDLDVTPNSDGNGGNFNIGGTTVIDASRNLTNIGGISADSAYFGTGVTIRESTTRSDLLEIVSNTTGWGGLSITNSSNEGVWSLMVNGANAGLYDEQNAHWHVYASENAGTSLWHNGTARLETTSTGVSVTGNVTAGGNLYTDYSILGSSVRSSGRGELFLNSTGANAVSEIFFGYGSGYTESNIRWGISDRGTTTGTLVFYKGPANAGGAFEAVANFSAGHTRLNVVGGYDVNGTNVIDSARNLANINNATVGGTLYVAEHIEHTGDTNTYINFPAADDMQLVAGGRQMLRMDEGTNPDLLQFVVSTTYTDSSGNIVASGNITAYASDRRLKTNIKPIENALDKVMAIRGVHYDWIDGVEDLGFHPGRKLDNVGVIAQEIEEVLPQVVKAAPFDQYRSADTDWEFVSKSGEDYKTVDYDKLTALLIEAVKEQQIQIDELKARIKEMKDGNH